MRRAQIGWMVVVAAATACSRRGTDGLADDATGAVTGDVDAVLAAPTLGRVEALAAGDDCPHGGTRTLIGADVDGDGVLDDEEVLSSSDACLPAPPTPLVRIDPVDPDATCPDGGQATHVGLDDDGDGVLSDAEIDATAVTCLPEPTSTTPTDPPPTGASPLVRVDVEPTGANCAYGGSAIRVGLDDDGDGVLGDAEVDSVDYVCAPPPTGIGLAYVEGDVVIENALDLALLSGVKGIGGNLTIQSSTLAEVDLLDSLEEVGGSLLIGAPKLSSLAGLAYLESVGGTMQIASDALVDLTELEALTSVVGLSVYGQRLERLGVPALTTVGSLSVNSPVLADVDLPSGLTSLDGLGVGGPATALTGLQTLEQVGSLDLWLGPTAPSPALGALRTAGAVTLDGPGALAAVPSLRVAERLEVFVDDGDLSVLAALEEVGLGGLFVRVGEDAASITGPSALARVDGTLSLRVGCTPDEDDGYCVTPTTTVVPVQGFSALTTVGGDVVDEGDRLATNDYESRPRVALRGFPLLASVGGSLPSILAGTEPRLPALQTVGGAVWIGDAADPAATMLPALSSVGALFVVGVDTPALDWADAAVEVGWLEVVAAEPGPFDVAAADVDLGALVLAETLFPPSSPPGASGADVVASFAYEASYARERVDVYEEIGSLVVVADAVLRWPDTRQVRFTTGILVVEFGLGGLGDSGALAFPALTESGPIALGGGYDDRVTGLRRFEAPQLVALAELRIASGRYGDDLAPLEALVLPKVEALPRLSLFLGALATLDLGSLASLDGTLTLAGLPAGASVDLGSLTTVQQVRLYDLDWTDLSPIASLRTITRPADCGYDEGEVVIGGLGQLADVSLLGALTTADGVLDVSLDDVPQLDGADLDALEARSDVDLYIPYYGPGELAVCD